MLELQPSFDGSLVQQHGVSAFAIHTFKNASLIRSSAQLLGDAIYILYQLEALSNGLYAL